MGRLPSTFENRVIQDRIPYQMPGEFVLTSGNALTQFPDATFQNTQNKPFEIHRMIPRVIPQLTDVVAFDQEALGGQPSQTVLAQLVRLHVTDLGLNQLLTKAPTLIEALVKGSSERTWEWASPHTIPNNAQLLVELQALTFPAGFDSVINQLRVAVTFQGFLLVVGPPVS